MEMKDPSKIIIPSNWQLLDVF